MSKQAARPEPSWQIHVEQVETALQRYVAPQDDCPPRLQEAMAYSLLAGGKRLRPVLALLACEACGGKAEAALPAACALEMVHTYSLIHDDLPAMDDDDLRRGRPTSHVVFGEAMAILAGDGLLTLAFEILARDICPGDTAAACCADLASAAGYCGMVGGQVADLEAGQQSVPNLETLERIHERKTGRLLRSALTMGGRIGGADAQLLDALDEYGRCVGLAFQIADDLLDVTGSEQQLGKAVGKDAGQGKLTYPSLLGIEDSRDRARELIERACQCLTVFEDERARPLKSLAQFVLERDH
ncbi:MAG: polyprenyl synthetase family protein [Planctomycetaceae bacterium]|nr:polyprenyl synthetase family protein [Planctomycetaceae bacterium]